MGMNPGSAGFAVARDEGEQIRRMADLESVVRENAAAKTLEASTIGAGGLRVKGGGSIVVEAPGTIQLTGGAFSAATISATTVAATTTVSAGTNITAGGTIAATGAVSGSSVAATGAVSAGGAVSGGGDGNFAGGLVSSGAAALDLSTIGGTRQPAWQHIASGRYGYAPSSKTKKAALSKSLPFTAKDVYATIPYVYEYIGQLAIRDDPENENYDPEYVVPTEIGLMAEYLMARNMSIFVVFEADGITPKSIDYAAFGAVANLVAVRDLNERLTKAGL